MNTVQINNLRQAYNNINTIDPLSNAYQHLIKFLDKQPISTLRTLADARIKFISPLATNRVNAYARATMKVAA